MVQRFPQFSDAANQTLLRDEVLALVLVCANTSVFGR